MIRLVLSEWLRFRSRRLVRVLALLAAAGVVIAVGIAFVQSDPPTDEQIARADRRAERMVERCIRQDGFGSIPDATDFEVESFCREQYGDPGLFLSDALRLSDLPEWLRATSFVAILLGLVIGASAVGASWQTGTMTTILTWEPRRIRVGVVRCLVVAVGAFLLAACLLLFFVAVFWLATSLRGVTEVPSGWTGETGGVILRIAMLSGLASVIGGGVAMLGRNTTATLGAVFIYMAVLEGIVRGLRPELARFLLGDNILAFVIGDELQLADGLALTPERGITVAIVYAVVLQLVGLASFRLRDVQ